MTDTPAPRSAPRAEPVVFDDRAVLAELQAGSAGALAVLHRRHAPSVYWVAFEMVTSGPDAEDIVQDAFILLWQKSRSIELAGVSVLPWLLATARYLALNVLKARSRREKHVTHVPHQAEAPHRVEEAAIASLELSKTEALIAAMPRIDRDIYRLCVVEGLCYKQAANRLRTTQPVVRNRLSRMRATLRKGLAQ